MKRGRAGWLVAGAAIAVAISTTETVGWFAWRSFARTMKVNPQSAVSTLGDSAGALLPSFVVRSRRLAVTEFSGAPVASLLSALQRTGSSQRRWMPANATGFVNLAREELIRAKPTESIEALADALIRDPNSPSLHRLQALFLFSVGDRKSALVELAVAEAIAPGLRDPDIDLTEEDHSTVRIEGLRLRSKYYPRRQTETSLALARELRKNGDQTAANSLLEKLRGRAAVEIELATWAIEEGSYQVAAEMLTPIATQSTNPRRIRARAWSMIAVARDLDGDGEGAKKAAGVALGLDPDSSAPYVTLAGLAQGRGDLQTALDHLRKAWGMHPGDTRLLTRIAWVAEQAGKPADALLALERAVEIAPGSPRLSTLLVELQLRTGHYTEAAVSLSRGLDRHPTDPDLLRLADRLPREIGIR